MNIWKNLKKWQKISLVVFGVFVLLGVMGAMVEEDTAVVNNETVAVAEAQSEEEQNVQSLAERVDAQLKETYGIESYTEYLLDEDRAPGSLIGYISKIEDEANGVVLVSVQTEVTKDEALGLARNILATVGFDIEDLGWLIVSGVDGRQHQASRNDIPALR